MNCKAILFDMDGVLIDTEPLHYKVWQVTEKKEYCYSSFFCSEIAVAFVKML